MRCKPAKLVKQLAAQCYESFQPYGQAIQPGELERTYRFNGCSAGPLSNRIPTSIMRLQHRGYINLIHWRVMSNASVSRLVEGKGWLIAVLPQQMLLSLYWARFFGFRVASHQVKDWHLAPVHTLMMNLSIFITHQNLVTPISMIQYL